MLEQIDAALTLIKERTMMDVQEVENILLDLRLSAMERQGETDAVLQEGTGPLIGAGQSSG